MKISNICSWTIGVLWLGLASNPAMGFTLDLFSETNANTADFYFNGAVLGNFPVDGQEVRVNQDIDPSGYLYKTEDSDMGLTTVEGGNRHIKIDLDSGTNPASFAVGTTADNVLNLNNNSGTTSIGTIVWNGSSSIDFGDLSIGAALNLDLEKDNDGDDSIGIVVKSADLGGTLNLTLHDGTNTYTDTQSIPVVSSGNSQTMYYNFSTYQTEGININSIQYISAQLTSPESSDIELDFLETTREVPFEFSPSLGIIIGSTFLSFKIYKLNKRKTARS